jgi:NADH-quinone oxidoreductase subunit A
MTPWYSLPHWWHFICRQDAGSTHSTLGFPLATRNLPFLSSSGMETSQLNQYVPVFLLALVALGFAFGTLLVSVLVGWRSKRSKIKDTAYECGMLPIGEGSTRMSVKFYLVAMLFILFDIEVVFLYPWAVVYREMLADPATRNLILVAMISFLGVLFVGYLYALKKRAFDWKS